MRLTLRGRHALDMREGDKLVAYRDTKGILTIGRGHTTAAGPPTVKTGMRITQAQSDEIFERDIAQWEDMLAGALKVPVADNQWDALLSILHNVGPHFLTSTCIRKINEGDFKRAAEAIDMWHIPPEIIGRRNGEKQQFMTPYPDTKPAPVKTAIHVTIPAPVHAPPVIKGLPPALTEGTFMSAFWSAIEFLKPLAVRAIQSPQFQSAAIGMLSGIGEKIAQNAHNPEAIKRIAGDLTNHAPGILGAIVKGTDAEKLVSPAIVPAAPPPGDRSTVSTG